MKTTRRNFLCGAALAVFSIVPARVLGASAPSKRINVAVIGTGNQGVQDMQLFLTEDDCQVVAVCDVNRGSAGYRKADQFLGREPAQKMVNEAYAEQKRSGVYRGCDAYNDFREVLARPDVDAVVLVVPDHWHRVMTVMAADAARNRSA
ncbi:MAG: Gfo/Idh/MocA family oxidoreductase [Kiritimatiellaeota bacterium]|nr:Gfo/Idh/MocA family oxidoreductase [Kiritimatiellota bacterium]